MGLLHLEKTRLEVKTDLLPFETSRPQVSTDRLEDRPARRGVTTGLSELATARLELEMDRYEVEIGPFAQFVVTEYESNVHVAS